MATEQDPRRFMISDQEASEIFPALVSYIEESQEEDSQLMLHFGEVTEIELLLRVGRIL